MTPHRGKHYSPRFLPATPSSPSLTLEGLFATAKMPCANLNCAFVIKTHFLHRSLIVKNQQNRIELVTRAVLRQANTETGSSSSTGWSHPTWSTRGMPPQPKPLPVQLPSPQQVSSLTHFYSVGLLPVFPFCEKSLICLEGNQ